MKKTIKFEGFVDMNSGSEFGLPIMMVQPKRILTTDHGNFGGIEHMIEDYMLNLCSSLKPTHDSSLKKRIVEEDFARAKKGSKRFKAWSATVEYDAESEEIWAITNKKGFK